MNYTQFFLRHNFFSMQINKRNVSNSINKIRMNKLSNCPDYMPTRQSYILAR